MQYRPDMIMRVHVLAILLLLSACFDALASDLYATINTLRAGAGDCAVANRLPPPNPQDALERVAQYLARGYQLEPSLKAVGYRATQANVIHFEGDGVGEQVAGMLATRAYCRQLQNAAVTEIGLFHGDRQLWIVMAAPFLPLAGISERSAGQRVLELVNQTRAVRRTCGSTTFNAARPVSWNAALANASRLHSESMARYNYFSHQGQDGSNPAQRAERAGYRYRATGENLAGGQINPEDAMAAWINSPAHCANLMNPAFTEMGVAFAIDGKSKLGVYWTQVFGAPR